MTSEFYTALELIGILDREFPGTQSLIVGGAVRDRLLDIEAHDVDIATNVPFDELEKRFDLNDITKNTVNAQPVSIITFKGFSFEIAAFRVDSWGSEGRANNVATITQSFQEDSMRRDITINAMGIDSNDKLVDWNSGRADIINRVIRAVGDPESRFREDATRILRVIRFAAKFDFSIEFYTSRAIEANKWRLLDREQISPESIAKEIFKAAKNGVVFARFIQLLDANGILEDILPELTALRGFMHDPQHHPEGGGSVIGHILACLVCSRVDDPVVNIGILFHDLGKAVTRGVKDNGHSNYHGHEGAGVPIVQGIFDRLKFNDLSAEDKDAILFAVGRHMLIHNIDLLALRTMVKLVHNPGWIVLKDVGFADEASRDGFSEFGISKFDHFSFNEKIARVERRVAKIASNKDDLRLKVKKYVDGNVLQEWFPVIKTNLPVLKPVLAGLADFILERLDKGESINKEQIYNEALDLIEKNQNL